MFANWSAKRKKRLKRRIYFFLIALFVTFALSLWFYMVYNPKFTLSNIKIIAPYKEYERIYRIVQGEIRRDSIFFPPSNVFFFDKDGVRRQILFNLPEVRDVFYSFDFKNMNLLGLSIGLRVHEYSFCDQDGQIYKTDKSGYVYEKADDDTGKLIICSKPEGTDMSIKRDYPIRFKIKDEDLNYVRIVKNAFVDFELKPRKIVFMPENELEVYFDNFKLKLVADSTVSDQIDNFKTAWNSSLKNIELEYVDARFDPKIYYKPSVQEDIEESSL